MRPRVDHPNVVPLFLVFSCNCLECLSNTLADLARNNVAHAPLPDFTEAFQNPNDHRLWNFTSSIYSSLN